MFDYNNLNSLKIARKAIFQKDILSINYQTCNKHYMPFASYKTLETLEISNKPPFTNKILKKWVSFELTVIERVCVMIGQCSTMQWTLFKYIGQ